MLKNQLIPEKLTLNPPDDQQLLKWLNYLEDEKTKICRAFLTEIYELNLSERAQPYIQLHQASLASLIDTLQVYSARTRNKQLKCFYEKISGVVDGIAAYIQEYLNKYIDHDLPVPQSYNKLLQEKLSAAIASIDTNYLQTQVDGSLLNIIKYPIQKFLDTPGRINFRKALYFQEITREVIELPHFYSDHDLVKRLHELLHSFNFNSPEYVNYCMRTLEQKLLAKETTQNRIELLEYYIKTINQLPLKVNSVLIPNLASVCDQMLIWINEEYKYLLSSQHNISLQDEITKRNKGMIKIKTSFSVPQLAAFLRIMIEKGVITNETNIEVLRFMAQNVATPHADVISEESLKNKFYNIEPGTIGQMREFFSGASRALDQL